MERLAHRWRQRQAAAWQEAATGAVTTVTVSEQVTVMIDPDALWRLVWDPATSPLVSDHVVQAFTLPGTPAGQVGELQVHVVREPDGTLVGLIEEVVEVGPGWRAVTRSRSTSPPITSTTLVLPLDGDGCVLRHRTDLIVPAEAVTVLREEYRAHSLQYLARVRDLAEATQRASAGQRGTPTPGR